MSNATSIWFVAVLVLVADSMVLFEIVRAQNNNPTPVEQNRLQQNDHQLLRKALVRTGFRFEIDDLLSTD